MGTNTPWGISDFQRKVANGIICYGTPSHGGYHLSETRLSELETIDSDLLKTFTGRGWYEEDCDWSIIRYMYAGYFKACNWSYSTLTDAIETIKHWKPEIYAKIQAGLIKPLVPE